MGRLFHNSDFAISVKIRLTATKSILFLSNSNNTFAFTLTSASKVELPAGQAWPMSPTPRAVNSLDARYAIFEKQVKSTTISTSLAVAPLRSPAPIAPSLTPSPSIQICFILVTMILLFSITFPVMSSRGPRGIWDRKDVQSAQPVGFSCLNFISSWRK